MAKYLPMLPKGKMAKKQKNFICHGMKSRNANSTLQLNEMEQK
jgi:hypothetical protein